MLKKRIIPILLLSKNLLIKTKKFSSDRVIGNIIQSIKIFNKRESDELVIIDVDASRGFGEIEIHLMKEIISECNMPISIGGGIKNNLQIKNLLNIGFDKVIINNSFIKNPDFISESVKIFGSQSITIGIDIIKNNNQFKIVCKDKNQKPPKLIDWIKFAQDRDVGEILITSVDLEGTMSGFDYNLLSYIYSHVKKPIIFNGGCGSIKDFKKILSFQKVMGACASSVFFFTEITPDSIKKNIKNKINVRT
jgi:cyclase